MEHQCNECPYSRYALHNYIADAKNDIYIDGQLRMMIENREQEIVGVIDLVNFDPKHQRAEMGIIIMKPFRQKGYAQAAISALIDYNAQWVTPQTNLCCSRR